ncbi:MAG: hypothetical protein EBW14_20440, partial [Oxalobacteraceae bacterium]|nr:hypothetical protein [Oxalobacteraceae bacterium]
GFDPQMGARPLKRLIQKLIVNALSKKILAGEVDKAKPVLVPRKAPASTDKV